MVRRLAAAGVAVVVAALLLVASWPQLLGLQRSLVLAELTALRGLIVLLAVAVIVLLAVVAGLWRAMRGVLVLVAVGVAGVVLLNLAVLANRGFGAGELPAAEPGDLTVAAWNTQGGSPGAELIAQLALLEGADVIALPETTRETAEEVARLLGAEGRPMQPLVIARDERDPTTSTALLVAESLGRYEATAADGEQWTLIARPVDGPGPVLVAAHPPPPLPGSMVDWEAGLAGLAELCRGGETIVAGDLNATLDHFEGLEEGGGDLGACRDGARLVGAAALGSWPAGLPEWLGAPIDHVMATPEWEFTGFRVVSGLDGSDHRPVVARLRPS